MGIVEAGENGMMSVLIICLGLQIIEENMVNRVMAH